MINTQKREFIETKDADIIQKNKKEIQEIFMNYHEKKGYKKINQQTITSNIDPTVLFVGSHSSIVKPMMLKGDIPNSGVYITQKCVRTQNTKKIFNDEPIKRGSNFTTLGSSIAPGREKTKKISDDTIDFLVNALNIPTKQITINISERDIDLQNITQQYEKKHGILGNIGTHTEPNTYYRHKYGEKDIYGRNFNIILSNTQQKHGGDIGNIVSIENRNEDTQLCTELGIGLETLIQKKEGYSHIFYAFNFADLIENFNNQNELKLRDCISTSMILLNEGLKPGSGKQNKVLRSYMRGILLHTYQTNTTISETLNKCLIYEQREFGSTKISTIIKIFLLDTERKIKSNKTIISKEEQKIKNLYNK